MKNKIFTSAATIALYCMMMNTESMAQADVQSSKSTKKDKLEQRNSQRNSNPSNDKENLQNQNLDQTYDQKYPHRGGFQNYGGRPLNYRHHGYRGELNNRRFALGYRSNRFNHFHPRINLGFDRPGNNRILGRGQRNQANKFKQKRNEFKNEMKTLKDQIWKDGSMDLNERELLRKKANEFHTAHPRAFNHMKHERLRRI